MSIFGSLYSRLGCQEDKYQHLRFTAATKHVQHLTPSLINIQSRYKQTNEAPVIIYYGGGKQCFVFLSFSICFHCSFSKCIVHVQRICRVTETETQTGAVRMEAGGA